MALGISNPPPAPVTLSGGVAFVDKKYVNVEAFADRLPPGVVVVAVHVPFNMTLDEIVKVVNRG